MHIRNTHHSCTEGKEEYDHLKNGFAPVIEEINEALQVNHLEIQGQIYELKYVFGGDYKVSQKLLQYVHTI